MVPERFDRLLKNPLLARLLKKVQMQGGTRSDGYPPQVGAGVLGSYAAAPRERAEYPSEGWAPIGMGTRQMGLFQQPTRRDKA